MKIGYIGLGIMGKSMARNIMKAGYPLVVHNRSRAAVDELVAEGAQAASSPAEVAEQVDVVFTNLPDSPDVEKVVLGPDGILSGAHPGLIFVDNSTIKPATARHLAEKLSEVRRSLPGCSGQRRRCWRSQRYADDHGRRTARSTGAGAPGVRGDGQEYYPYR
jgi:3-hydroxyisobutyrate dehydrogenase-like beta-hydroxyacid dehydrogenase